MDRREALEVARSMAPEASAAEHVEYAAFLMGSEAGQAPGGVVEVLRWGTDYPDGSIALYSGGYGVYVMEFGGWFFYSPIDGHRYSIREDPIGGRPYIVGMVRSSLVGQNVLESDERLYSGGTVAIDDDGDVWYYLGGGKWIIYFREDGHPGSKDHSTKSVALVNAVIVA